MESKTLILTAAVLIVFSVTGALGQITCYNCNSYWNGSICLDPMGYNVPVITRPEGYVCTKVSYVTGSLFVTSRSSDPGTNTCNNLKSSLQHYYPDLSRFKCDACKKNYCNNNSAINVSLVTLLFGAVMAKMM